MSGQDTSIGQGQDSFPVTTWTSILAGTDADSPERAARLNRLLSAYWRPVYKFVRATRRKSVEDAKDLTQEFFCHVVEGDMIRRYRPDAGRFRHFLKGALRKFLIDAHREGERLKRGGGRTIVSLDVEEVETEKFLADVRERSPEEIFDRQWAREIMARCLQRLLESLRREGKEDYVEVYEAYQADGPGGRRPTYDDVAASLRINRWDVMNRLNAVRNRLQELIIEEVSDYVTSRSELEEEIREMKKLFA